MPTNVFRIRWRLAIACAVLAIVAVAVFLTGGNDLEARPNPQPVKGGRKL